MKSFTAKRRVACAGIAVLLVGPLAACGSSGSGGQAKRSTSKQSSENTSATETGFIGKVNPGGSPVTGGILKAAPGTSEPLGLDPIKDTVDGTSGSNEYAAIFDTLVRYDPVSNKYLPQLAQSFSADASNMAWTIKLRPGVRFTDGTVLDATAVKYNLQRWSSPDSIQYYYFVLSELGQIDTPDPMTVVIHLKSADAQFPYLLTQGLGMIGSPTAIKKGESAYNLHPIGAGPFMVAKYTPGQSLQLVRNPNYWAGSPPLDGITFTWPNDETTKLQAVKSGDLDLANLISPPVIHDALSSGLGGFLWIRYGGALLVMNGRTGHPTSDQRVRQAIAYAMNVKAINDRVYQGKAIVSTSIFPSGPFKTSVPSVTYDPTKAKALLAAAKASSGWDGSISILCYAEPLSQAQALAFQAQLDAVGFKVKIDAAPSISAFTSQVYVKYNYDLAVSGLVVTVSNPWAQLDGNISGPLSTFGVDDPSLNAALNDLHAADSNAATVAALNKLQLAWNTVQPGAVISVGQYTDIWSSRVRGVVPSSNNTLLFGKAWLAK